MINGRSNHAFVERAGARPNSECGVSSGTRDAEVFADLENEGIADLGVTGN